MSVSDMRRLRRVTCVWFLKVLLDSSSSMGEECFDKHCKMKRIEAIKEIFDSFANRCMAYNFEQVICLVKFDSVVKTLHSFTETVETFKVNGSVYKVLLLFRYV